MKATEKATAAYKLLASGDAPDGMVVEGVLDYSAKSDNALPKRFPRNLQADVIDLTDQPIEVLPEGLSAYEINLSGTPIREIPASLKARVRLDLSGCDHLETLPAGLTVGTLTLRGCTALRSLPELLDVWFLDLSGCWAFENWPKTARIRSGQLQLRGCTAVRSVPPYLKRIAALNVCDCPNLSTLPSDLVVTGWVDIARSGLTEDAFASAGLSKVQLRWAGINIDRRIGFHPELISIDEVLTERNSEKRRAILDRYGYGRFLTDADAEILNEDTDPGGPRQLLRVKLPGDEDLVALSCFCPSTDRQYIIRVPPDTSTCHVAAAWIAGFDDPQQYDPIIET